MPSSDTAEARATLDNLRDELNRQLSEIVDADYDDGFADSAQVAAEQGEQASLSNQLNDQLAEVEAAIDRLDKGDYGVCEVCGKAIGADRLEVMPATRFCIDDASAAK